MTQERQDQFYEQLEQFEDLLKTYYLLNLLLTIIKCLTFNLYCEIMKYKEIEKGV